MKESDVLDAGVEMAALDQALLQLRGVGSAQLLQLGIEHAVEQRRSPRIAGPFWAIVRSSGGHNPGRGDTMGNGNDNGESGSQRGQAEATVTNISACGLYMLLDEPVEAGSKLLIVVRFSTQADRGAPTAKVAVSGIVMRVETQLDGRYGIAVDFTRDKFLYAA